MTLRAITVKQPWAWAIVHGGKDVENRTRNIAGTYRGPVAIHAGMVLDTDAERSFPAITPLINAAYFVGRETPARRGVVLGVVDLVDVHHAYRDAERCHEMGTPEPGNGWCSLWAEQGGVHLVLRNPRPLPRPVPVRGRLGLWTLPGDVEAAVREQVAL